MSGTLKEKNILIGITGGISAYKICSLIRMFKKANGNVKVVLSPDALEFVGTKTFETLSENEVFTNQFAPNRNTEHISLADWADVYVIAPLSANTLGKFANGICDNLLTSVFSAYFGKRKPVILAPAMNDGMWNNTFVQKNLKSLRAENCIIIDPETGFLACGTEGTGRLADIKTIFESCKGLFGEKNEPLKPLKGKKILITAGGTREFIDPVRYIGNCSSGKTGTALALAASELGAEVELICTFEPPQSISNAAKTKITQVESAAQMQDAVETAFPDCDCLIMAAAVADFRVKSPAKSKISKTKIDENGENLILELVKNPDILKGVASKKRENQTVIGFCLSTENVIENAKKKRLEKNCDFIIANEAKTALGTDKTDIWIIDKKQNVRAESGSKTSLAGKILELIK